MEVDIHGYLLLRIDIQSHTTPVTLNLPICTCLAYFQYVPTGIPRYLPSLGRVPNSPGNTFNKEPQTDRLKFPLHLVGVTLTLDLQIA